MPAGANTNHDIGIRRMITSIASPAYRNFEVNGTQTYNVIASSYSYAGSAYAQGATIPYDSAGGTLYSNPAQLERDFNSGMLDPSS